MLLHQVKHSCPDLANTTRELLKANNCANPAAYKELLHVIKYVLDTKNLGLKHKKIICFSYSDYAGDTVSSKSISSFILYVIGIPASWQSKLWKSASLSNSEAEHVALSEAVKEVIFMIQLLECMKINVNIQSQ